MSATIRSLRAESRAYLAKYFPEQDPTIIGLECDALLADPLECSTCDLIVDRDREISDSVASVFWSSIKRRAKFEPVAYILGYREFYGRNFICKPVALIPRPDTELLIERVLERYKSNPLPDTFFDIGSGTGCIGLSLAAEFLEQGWQGSVLLSDISPDALELARVNAKQLGLESCSKFACGDLLSSYNSLPSLVVSNPPYISENDELMCDVDKYEPQIALRSGADGLKHISRLLEDWALKAAKDSVLYLEIGHLQRHKVESLAQQYGVSRVESFRDLSGTYRVVEIER